jgi:CheY-like chemotaxis protein
MVIKTGFDTNPVTFQDGTDAIQYLSNNTPPPKTIIFLDINMPNTGAWDFLDAIEKFSFVKYISIVIITSSISRYDQKKAEKYTQIVDYIIKPVTLKHLVSLKEKLD